MAADATTFVYIGNSDSQDISVFALKPNGDLGPVETMAVPGPEKPGGSLPLAVSPDKRYLYVGLRNEPFAAVTFAINPNTGKLAYIGKGPLADSMAYISTDRTGKFLFGASYGGSKVTVSPIGADGIVGAAIQSVSTLPNAHAVIVDPTNKYVLHTSLGGDAVYQQKFDATTGTLSPNDPPTVSVKAKGGPRHLVFSPDGKFVYVIDELSGAIHVFPWDAATGSMKPEVQGATSLPPGFDGKPWAGDIHVTLDGRFLYVTERASHTLSGFRIDKATGTLTLIAAYPTEKQPRAFNIDPSGSVLLVAGQLSNSVTAYAIDKATGALSELEKYTVGQNPNWIEFVTVG